MSTPESYENQEMRRVGAHLPDPSQRELELEAEVVELKQRITDLLTQAKDDAEWLNKLRVQVEAMKTQLSFHLSSEHVRSL